MTVTFVIVSIRWEERIDTQGLNETYRYGPLERIDTVELGREEMNMNPHNKSKQQQHTSKRD